MNDWVAYNDHRSKIGKTSANGDSRIEVEEGSQLTKKERDL